MEYMPYQEILARQCVWATKSIANNLNFIPDDKLDWKPAPTASSALEIVQHLAWVLAWAGPRLGGAEPPDPEVPVPTSRAEAQQQIIQAGQGYAAALRAVPTEHLSHPVQWRALKMPIGRAMVLPVSDCTHHHGQITYIQTLLGDTETHRDLAAIEEI